MRLSTSFVAVRKIISSIDSSIFSDGELNHAAKLILEAEGIINPIILRRISLDSYEVIDGHFEYYAAVRAREKNLSKGEMIGAFVVEPENEKVLKDQVEALRKQGYSENITELTTENLSQRNVKTLIDKVEQVAKVVKIVEEVDRNQTNTQGKLESITDQVEQITEAVKRIELLLNKPLELTPKYLNLVEPPLEKMTVPQLRVKAKEKGIKGYTNLKKAQLIEALTSTNAE